jgi:hypothetical protein
LAVGNSVRGGAGTRWNVAVKDGRVVFLLEGWQIEGGSADEIAKDLVGAFDQFCAPQPAERA